MDSQRNELIALAAEHGWTATKTDNFDAHDWSVETWELESLWSPVGTKAYVTFPIDEHIYRERKPWAIMVTAEPPVSAPAADYFQTSLIQWKNETGKFISFLDRVRAANKDKAPNE